MRADMPVQIRHERKDNMDVQRKRNRCALAVIVLFAALAVFFIMKKPGIFAGKHKQDIITESTLEKIIKVSDLSVFETVYNGVAQVYGPEDETDFYAYYEARVKAGIDLKEVDIVMDGKNKKISVTLPAVKINEIIVDESSLDYIFINKKADNEMAFQRAYKAAETDVAAEAEDETAIYELAGENAANIVEALIKPFVLQLDAEYEMEISLEDGTKNET